MNTPASIQAIADTNANPISHTAATVIALADALRVEERLLGELTEIVRSQREAVARDDVDALDDSVYATHRILRTLGEARRQRRALNHLLGESDDLSLQALSDAFDGHPPELVSRSIASLSTVANTLHREVEVNSRVLAHAIHSGDQLVRVLSGVADAPSGYTPSVSPAAGRTFLDRTV